MRWRDPPHFLLEVEIMAFYLGVDMGTSSIKATLTDEEGRIVQNIKVPSEIINPREGFFEVDPMKTWWGGFLKVCTAIGGTVNLHEIDGICISSVCGSFVPVDKDLEPLYNAVLYGIDRRSESQVRKMNNSFEEYMASAMGGSFTTHSILPKILWFRENLPDIYSRTASFVESNNFVSSRLTGKVKWDYPTAAGGKLVDFNTLGLPYKVMEKYSLDPEKIPPFDWPVKELGKVTEKAASVTGLRAGTPVVLGACDINAEAMSVRAVHPGELTAVFGSTLSILLTTDRYVQPEGFVSGMSLLENTYRIGAATSSGGRFLEWFRNNVARSEGAETRNASEPTGILVIPYIDGARTPFNDPYATSAILGITSGHSAEDIHTAALESLGYELTLLFDRMSEAYPLPDVIQVTGGLSNDPELMRRVADITGKTLMVHRGIDASFGDALLAMLGRVSLKDLYRKKGLLDLEKGRECISPDPSLSAKYEPLKRRYCRLCRAYMMEEAKLRDRG
jgi:xylulokinase